MRIPNKEEILRTIEDGGKSTLGICEHLGMKEGMNEFDTFHANITYRVLMMTDEQLLVSRYAVIQGEKDGKTVARKEYWIAPWL